ncbi:hypothetical protein [Rheinheimera sp.]|uniref:hypothetical protein n=1 Tax=Rheinheimera sp. TaxID=1869214 RepID=UPI0037C51268
MKVLSDVWSSITGNVNTRVKDPVIGSFAVAWIICNWDKLAILFLGENKVEERIGALVEKMAIIEKPALIYQDLDLLALPTVLTLFYLFFLPPVSLWVNQKQKKAIIAQHSHAVDVDILHAKKQLELNKEKLRSNPNKGFLEKDVELDIQRQKARDELRNKIRNEYLDKKIKSATALASKRTEEAAILELQRRKLEQEVEEKERKSTSEKLRFERQSQILKATIASNRFPAAYFFLQRLSGALREDNIVMSLEGLSETVAAIFGYDNFEQMINDEDFTNDNLERLKYVLADNELVNRLDEICKKEVDKEEFDPEVIFQYIQTIFEDQPYEFLSEDGLIEAISICVNEDSFDILNSEELSGPIAETDTIFEELELEVESYQFKENFSVKFQGYASGPHRKESDMRGRDLEVRLTAISKPIIGSFGLGELEYEIDARPRDYE